MFQFSTMKLMKDNKVLGFGNLDGNLFKFELYPTHKWNVLTLHDQKVGIK